MADCLGLGCQPPTNSLFHRQAPSPSLPGAWGRGAHSLARPLAAPGGAAAPQRPTPEGRPLTSTRPRGPPPPPGTPALGCARAPPIQGKAQPPPPPPSGVWPAPGAPRPASRSAAATEQRPTPAPRRSALHAAAGKGGGGTHAHWPGAAARRHARTHARRTRGAQAAARVEAPGPPQRPLGGARWGPARPARSFTYSKRHPCGRPTAPTFWALLPSPSPAGAPGTPTSSAPSRPAPRPAAAAAARTPARCRRLSCLRRRRRHHLPRLFRPAGPRPPPPAGHAPALPPSRPPPRARQPPLGGPAPPTRPRAGPRAAQAPRGPLSVGAGPAPRRQPQSACG